jgi:hypothetical protein
MPESDHLAMDYICWLSAEVTSLSEVFAGVNENFVSATVEGTLVMVGDSIDFATMQTMAADSRACIVQVERDMRRATCAVSKKWWRSFNYEYVLGAIRAKLREVITHVSFVLL